MKSILSDSHTVDYMMPCLFRKWVFMKSYSQGDLCVRVLSVTAVSLGNQGSIGARQAPLSMRVPRQEYRSGLPFPPPGDLSKSGIKPSSLRPPTLAGSLAAEPLGKPLVMILILKINNADYIF